MCASIGCNRVQWEMRPESRSVGATRSSWAERGGVRPGVLHDNEGELPAGIRCYERFLEAARAALSPREISRATGRGVHDRYRAGEGRNRGKGAT